MFVLCSYPQLIGIWQDREAANLWMTMLWNEQCCSLCVSSISQVCRSVY